MRIAILGGTFDPPHKGHLAMAAAVLAAGEADRVWFMPCNEHAYGKKMAPAIDRVHMCWLTVESLYSMSVSTYQIANGMSGKSWDLAERIQTDPTFEGYQFSLVVSMDNAAEIDRWHRGRELIDKIRFIVLSRKGYQEPANPWYLGPNHCFINADIPEMSSTAIRAMPQHHFDKVVPAVYSHILRKGLYPSF